MRPKTDQQYLERVKKQSTAPMGGGLFSLATVADLWVFGKLLCFDQLAPPLWSGWHGNGSANTYCLHNKEL